jgi:hypothetical protein
VLNVIKAFRIRAAFSGTVQANFREHLEGEVRIIPLLRTSVNKAKNEGRSVKELQPWAIPKLYR